MSGAHATSFETMREVTSLSCETLQKSGLVFEVAVTSAQTASAEYFDIAQCESDEDIVQALRATMAIPLLYPRSIAINGAAYVDGGISDPLPVLRAFDHNPDTLIAISSVLSVAESEVVNTKKARLIRYAPKITNPVRNLMLTSNPLAGAADDIMRKKSFMG